MDNKQPTYIVTGATGSIGKEIALNLSKNNFRVILGCRSIEKAQELQKELIVVTGNKAIEYIEIDLSSIKSVLKFVDEIKSKNIEIDGLINNAGIMCREFTITDDGFETSFQVNFLSVIILTSALYPIMSNNGKIVFTTSITRKLYKAKDICFEPNQNAFSQLADYAKSKLALTHYALHIAENEKGIIVNCADPGVVDSNMITMHRWYDPIANRIFRPFISTPASGAKATLRALEAIGSKSIYTQTRKKDIPVKWEKDINHSRIITKTNSIISKYGISPIF